MKKQVLTAMTAAAMTAMIAGSAFAEDYKIGIIKFVDDASLDQIQASIMAELDARSAEGEDNFIYEGYVS